jgi:hypothetical protein
MINLVTILFAIGVIYTINQLFDFLGNGATK